MSPSTRSFFRGVLRRAPLVVRIASGRLTVFVAAALLSGCGSDAPTTPQAPAPVEARADFGVWQPTWNVSTIPPLPHYDQSHVSDISDNGRVVGYSWHSSTGGGPSLTVHRPFYWTQAGGAKELPMAYYNDGFATAVSDGSAYAVGHVAGPVAVRWRFGRSVSFDTLPRCEMGTSIALGVNDAGIVVGATIKSGVTTAVKWTSVTACPTPITVTGATVTGARAINDHGAIVGMAFSPAKGFMTGSVTLPSKLLPLAGDLSSDAFDVNDTEEVVGLSWNGSAYAAIYRNPVTGNTIALGPASQTIPVRISDRGRTTWGYGIGGRTTKGTTLWTLPFVPFGVNACGDIIGRVSNGTSLLYKKAVCD